jgi:hypothetical protein
MAQNKSFSKNVELVAYHDLNEKPGFQMAMQEVNGKYYLYLAHFKHSGWAIVDVTEPSNPRYVRFVPGPDKPGQTTLKIQVADGLMIGSLSGGIPMLHGTSLDDPYEAGISIWDVKDPENPRWLSDWRCGGFGVHRFFYAGGRYVHLSATCPGFNGFIYRVLDIAEPASPVEVGRWWMPEQWEAGAIRSRETPFHEAAMNRPSHHGPAYIKGDLAYCSWGGAGMVILDISNKAVPQFVGQLKHQPPFAGGLGGARCHTVIPLSRRPYAIMTSEGERFCCFNKEIIADKPQPLNFIGMVNVSDPANPTLSATFPYPEIPPGYPNKNFNEIEGVGAPGPFGPHNLHEPHYNPALEDRNDRIYCAYFHAGLRIYDISDPFVPREIAYYIPPDPKKWLFNNAAGNLFPGPNIATAEDVLVDSRGYIYLDTFQDGLYILRSTV